MNTRVIASSCGVRDEKDDMKWKGKSSMLVAEIKEGKLVETERLEEVSCNAMYFAIKGGQILATEGGDEANNIPAGIRAVVVGEDGKLHPREDLVFESPKGSGPCHLSVSGNNLAVAEYMNSVTLIDLTTGEKSCLKEILSKYQPITPGEGRQDASHPHCAQLTSDYLFISDLGTDVILIYDIQKKCHTAIKISDGAGVRHVVKHPNLPILYAVAELSNELIVCNLDGCLLSRRSCLPLDWTAEPPFPFYTAPSHAAAIRITEDGSHVYICNRGHDSITTFTISSDGMPVGDPTFAQSGGHIPWDISIMPGGEFAVVANQYTRPDGKQLADGNISLFTRCQKTGNLTYVNCISKNNAVCVAPW
eukprot:TRINITY_DN27865_c0_g1_i1.p1 TRINITY_DN27865_c0_g1~~TRINITY_DN27865_c0_g1_i1.p1  ORF type:complete len:379 (+),score=70.41 TRINITY_DN27865_c0_g1_i1:50-1138(+)